MDTVNALSFLNLPAEIRNIIYRFHLLDSVDAVIGFDLRQNEDGGIVARRSEPYSFFRRSSLAILRTSQQVYHEASACLRSLQWSLILRRCSIKRVQDAALAVQAMLPSWIYPNITTLCLEVADYSWAVQQQEEFIRRVRAEPQHKAIGFSLFQIVPLAQMTDLKYCHIVIEDRWTRYYHHEMLRWTVLPNAWGAGRILDMDLGLTPANITAYGGDKMRGINITALVDIAVGDGHQDMFSSYGRMRILCHRSKAKDSPGSWEISNIEEKFSQMND